MNHNVRDYWGRFAKQCAHCKGPRPSRNKRYCSKKCSEQACAISFPQFDPTLKRKDLGKIICKHCKKSISKKWRGQIFCNRKCRNEFNSRRWIYAMIRDKKRRQLRRDKKIIRNETVTQFLKRLKKDKEELSKKERI